MHFGRRFRLVINCVVVYVCVFVVIFFSLYKQCNHEQAAPAPFIIIYSIESIKRENTPKFPFILDSIEVLSMTIYEIPKRTLKCRHSSSLILGFVSKKLKITFKQKPFKRFLKSLNSTSLTFPSLSNNHQQNLFNTSYTQLKTSS